MTDRNDEPRDRSFGPAVQAAVERARNASTDPNWRPDAGGLPESGPVITWRGGTYASAVVPWPSPTAGTVATPEFSFEKLYLADGSVIPLGPQSDGEVEIKPSTIDPPRPEPFSPAQRAELERILLDMDVARERLRKLLEVA